MPLLRTTVVSSVVAGAPAYYFLQPHVAPYRELLVIGLLVLLPTLLVLLVRYTKRRAQQQTLDMLINGRPVFQRIIAEMEARAKEQGR
jgi:hypothetical protein